MGLIRVAPFGSPPDSLLASIRDGLQEILDVATSPDASLPELAGAFDAARGQWNSGEILKAMLARLPQGEDRVLAVTERDLFVPVLSFVFGQAQLEGRVAIVSLARLRPEWSGLPPSSAVLEQRALKEAVHEIGHTYGLVHCVDRSCPMSLSIGLADLDQKGAVPCRSCTAMLDGNLELQRDRVGGRGPGGER